LLQHRPKRDQEQDQTTSQGQNGHRNLEIFQDVPVQQASQRQRRQGEQHGARRQKASQHWVCVPGQVDEGHENFDRPQHQEQHDENLPGTDIRRAERWGISVCAKAGDISAIITSVPSPSTSPRTRACASLHWLE
jgi:hypothetical protein